MGIFKLFKRKKKRQRRSKRQTSGKRFFRAMLLSAIVSFVATSWAINPQIFEGSASSTNSVVSTVSKRVSALSLDAIDLKTVADWVPDLPTLNPIKWVSTALSDKSEPDSQPLPVANTEYIRTGFEHCPQFFPAEHLPVVPAEEGLRELCFTPFAILHSGKTKTPIFVAQRLNRQMLLSAKEIKRTDRFYEEARLPRAERSALGDYQGSGFDRGHMAPAGDMHDQESMAQSFSLANIVPQNAQHNRGAWSKIEADTRKYVSRAQGDVYIFTGPVYEGHPETIGERRVAIPKYLFKVVYDATTKKAWVHWHENSADTRVGAPISYAEFVQRTGLRLLDSEQVQ